MSSSRNRDRDHRKHEKKKRPAQSMFLSMNKKGEQEPEEAQFSSSSEDENEKLTVRDEKMVVEDTERLKDIEERNEFAERLRAKDDEHTKRKMDKQSNKVIEEAAKRLKLEKEDRKKVIPELREASRQVYLERREADKLAELEQEVHDEEYLWAGVKLTEYERKRMEQKKKTLEIAKQYKEADKLEKVDRYYIPSEEKKDRNDKYSEDIKEKGQLFFVLDNTLIHND